MKLIYLTDIHDALKELRVLLSSTEADVYILSGDILYKAFYDEDKIYQFVCLQEEFYTLAKTMEKRIYPMDLATDILRFPDSYQDFDREGDLEKKATEYRQLFDLAARTMKEKYELIDGLIVKYAQVPCMLLPGNYDIDLRYTALNERDMHQKKQIFNGSVFAGYGGAPIATSGIPEKLAVVYHEDNTNGKLYSEPEDFFNEARPDIMLLHNPAYGFFDRVPGLGHVGGLGVRNYLDDHKPALVLSGHVHEDHGAMLKGGTVYLNPSNFGGVDSPYGWQTGGAYAEIFMESGQVEHIVIKRLVHEEHQLLLEIFHKDATLQAGRRGKSDENHLSIESMLRDSNGAPIV